LSLENPFEKRPGKTDKKDGTLFRHKNRNS
jgi:hypothetical protein